MSKSSQTKQNDSAARSLIGAFRSFFQAGLGVAESMHRFTVEVPLNMLPIVGVSEEQTTELKNKHRNLLRSMYGSIDSLGTRAMDFGADCADRLTDEVSGKVEKIEDAVEETTVVAQIDKEAA